MNAASTFHVLASHPLRAKALRGPPDRAFLAGLLAIEREQWEAAERTAEAARMTAEALKKRVAYIADYLRESEPSNVPATPARRVEATPPPPESTGDVRPSPASAKARGAMGWTPERREAMARRAAARNSAKANSQSSPKANREEPKANSQSYQSSPKAPEGGRGGWSRSPSGSPSPAFLPEIPVNPSSSPSSSGSSSPREAQSSPKAPQSSEAPKANPAPRHKIEVRSPPPPPVREEERREEEDRSKGVEGERETPEAEGWHRNAYATAIRAAYGRPWTLDGKGLSQVPILTTAVYGGYLAGSTEREAWAWYQEQAALFVTRQVSDRPDLSYFRPEQFLAWLERSRPPHAAAERRRATARYIQERVKGWKEEPPEVHQAGADGAMAALASCFVGQLKGPKE